MIRGFTSEFAQADYVLCNLECPLIPNDAPANKNGWKLRAEPKAAEILRQSGFNVANLANNHIMDHGVAGLNKTINALESAGLLFLGAGANLAEARKPLVLQGSGLSVGLMSVSIREFHPASDNRPGANPLDLTMNIPDLRRLKEKVDHVILILHAGAENYPYPSPQLQRLCRLFAESGADVVVCQHSHCIGAAEVYNESHILYGQGNFLFDWGIPLPEEWNTGLLMRISCEKNDIHVQYFPCRQTFPGVARLKDQPAEQVMCAFKERSQNILNPDFLKANWNKFCQSEADSFVSDLLSAPTVVRKIIRRLKAGNRLISVKQKQWLLYVLRNESRREILETILEHLVDEKHAV